VVSAAGRLGRSIVGQIAKIRGCTSSASPAAKDKCHWLTSELGFYAAVDYKTVPPTRHCGGAHQRASDVYFDNSAGDILEACSR